MDIPKRTITFFKSIQYLISNKLYLFLQLDFHPNCPDKKTLPQPDDL